MKNVLIQSCSLLLVFKRDFTKCQDKELLRKKETIETIFNEYCLEVNTEEMVNTLIF